MLLEQPEHDPRARLRLTRLLLEQGVQPPLQPLLDALDDERTFLGTPWGPRLGQEATKALRQWLGDDFPKPDPEDKPGLTATITGILAGFEVNVLDIGQAVIHDTLSLGVLVEFPGPSAESSILKDILFRTWEMGMQVRFTQYFESLLKTL